MNMMGGPKFRRKGTSATGSRPAAETPAPVPPLDEAARAASERKTEATDRAKAESDARERAQDRARREADLEQRARAEALRRIRARRAQEAEEATRRADAERQAEERAAEALRKAKADRARQAEEQRRAKEAREANERREAEEAAIRNEAERQAEERAAEALRMAEADRAREANEQRRAKEARETEEAQRPLKLTNPVPVPDVPREADHDRVWAALAEVTVDKAHLDRTRIITASRDDPAHAAFDVLRTRLLQALTEHGWRRVAITSPGQNCGKTFAAANLAISLSRQENCRTILMDLDMRRPNLADTLGIEAPGALGDMLRGTTPPEAHLRRMGSNPVNAGRNIAFALNDRAEPYASELLQDPHTDHLLRDMEDRYGANVVLMDLPPALFYDDVIAARALFDGVLIVVGGGLTTQHEVTEVQRRLGGGVPILGMILNKAEGTEIDRYSY